MKRFYGLFFLCVFSVAAHQQQQQAPVAQAAMGQAPVQIQPGATDLPALPDSGVVEIHLPPKKKVRPVKLPANSTKTLAMSQEAINVEPDAHQDKDGRVIFTFGKGIPTVVCAPFQVCEIDFEPGEIVGEENMDSGDSKSLEVAVKKVGTGATAFSYLVVKPIAENLTTTMTIGTDRRIYYIRVLSMASDGQFMPRVAFTYPEEEAAKAASAS